MAIDRRSIRHNKVLRRSGIALLALVTAAVVACGGGEKPTVVTTTAPATPTAAVQATPDELGAEIGALYVRALSDVTELLRENPAAAQVTASVRQLKETYVQRLVELGRAREALDASGRAAVDAATRAKIDAIAGEPWYATYNYVAQHYLTQDEGLHELVVSFNVIGQYANFDLLRQQEPEEAKRLAVE